jgi:AsmA protein
MGTVIKRALIVLLALVIILGVALGAITALFNPNDYKDEIEQIALDKAGIDLNIKGDISWSVYPTLGFSIQSLDARFEGQPDLGTLNSAALSVNLPALIAGNVEMNAIEIDGLNLTLIKNATGQGNWEQARKTDTSTSDATAKEPTSTDASNPSEEKRAVSFNIKSIALINSHIRYQDQSSGQQYELKDLNIQSGEILEGAAFPVSVKATLIQNQGTQREQTVDLDASTDLTLNLSSQQYLANNLKVDLTLHAEKLIKLTLKSEVTANLAEGQVSLDDLKTNLANAQLNGNLLISGLNADQTSIKGALNSSTFAVNSLLEELGLPVYAIADSSALNHVQLSTQISGTPTELQANSIAIKLDDTQLSGQAAYRLSDGRILAQLKGDKINLDRYLPPETESAGQAKAVTDGQSGTVSSASEKQLPLEALRRLNLDLSVAFDQLTAKKLDFKQLDTRLSAAKGVITLNKANMQVLGGSVNSSGTLNVTSNTPKLAINKSVKGLQLGDLLTQLNGSAPITGSLSTQANITATGLTQQAIMNSLNGTIDLTLTNGVIQGIDMAQQMCQTINNISAMGQLSAAAKVDGSTPFAKMSGRFNVKNGVISNNDLNVDLDAMNLSGKGTASLPESSLDYRLGLVIQDNLFNKTCTINNKLEGVTWPIRCKGSFDTAPAELCKPDVEAMQDMVEKALKEKAKEEVKSKVKDKVEEKIKDKLGDDKAVKGLLDKLL